MADKSKIEWTDATWNPVNGCTVYSPGCTNCYAMKQAHRFPVRHGLTTKSKGGMVWTGEVRLNEKALLQPLGWRKPRMIFVCAHGDLFHESVPDAWIDRVFAVMALAPQHTFQVLTKRSARMREYCISRFGGWGEMLLTDAIEALGGFKADGGGEWGEPLPNVWLGVSVEDQTRADERIPDLLATPAKVRWLSCEPLLGPVIIRDHWMIHHYLGDAAVDWIVTGGESGANARPMHPDWARSLRDQCAAADVPFFFKQWGEWCPIGQSGFIQWSAATGLKGNRKNAGKAYSLGYASFNDGAGRPETARIGPVRTLHNVLTVGKSGGWTCAKIGKKAAGHLLDGTEHHAFPQVQHG